MHRPVRHCVNLVIAAGFNSKRAREDARSHQHSCLETQFGSELRSFWILISILTSYPSLLILEAL